MVRPMQHGRLPLTDFQRAIDPEAISARMPRVAMAPGEAGGTLRILSWNIGRGYDPGRIADTIGALRPDIACLQEVDCGNARTRGRDVLQILADRTGMTGLFGVEFLELASPQRTRRLAGGGATGNALLSRLPPRARFRIELPPLLDWEQDPGDPALPPRLRRVLRGEPRRGRRFALAAEYAAGPARLLACSVHLEDKVGGVAGRFRQYVAVLEAIAARRGGAPDCIVVAGDLNTFDSPLARLHTRETDATALGKPRRTTEASWWKSSLLPRTGFTDPFLPANRTFRVPPLFRAKLDWITFRGGTVHAYGSGAFSSSDHRPIWIDLDPCPLKTKFSGL